MSANTTDHIQNATPGAASPNTQPTESRPRPESTATTSLVQVRMSNKGEGQKHHVVFIFVFDHYFLVEKPSIQDQVEKAMGFMGKSGKSYEDNTIYGFDYAVSQANDMKGFLDTSTLEGRASSLIEKINTISQPGDHKLRVILFGYGYGGLICEQAALLKRGAKGGSDSPHEWEMYKILLLGTPHFQQGLTQWVAACGTRRQGGKSDEDSGVLQRMNQKTKLGFRGIKILGLLKARNGGSGRLSGCNDSFKLLENMQNRFREAFPGSDRIVCCIAEDLSLSTPTVSPEWCILPDFTATSISGTYSEMNGFTKELDYTRIVKLVSAWTQDKTHTTPVVDDEKKISNPISTPKTPTSRNKAGPRGSSRQNKRRRVDLTEVLWKKIPSQSITVGAVLANGDDMEPLATADETGLGEDLMRTKVSAAMRIFRLDKVKKHMESSENHTVYLVLETPPAQETAGDTVISGAPDEQRNIAGPSHQEEQMKEVKLLQITLSAF